MSTTNLRLPDQLKVRIAEAAKQAGTTSQKFILKAIVEKVERVERFDDFYRLADQRYADFLASGNTLSWDDVRGYLASRIAGRPAQRPVARKLVR